MQLEQTLFNLFLAFAMIAGFFYMNRKNEDTDKHAQQLADEAALARKEVVRLSAEAFAAKDHAIQCNSRAKELAAIPEAKGITDKGEFNPDPEHYHTSTTKKEQF